jgi:hypothetical protein
MRILGEVGVGNGLGRFFANWLLSTGEINRDGFSPVITSGYGKSRKNKDECEAKKEHRPDSPLTRENP